MTELESFMREYHYNRIVKLAATTVEHPWSRRQTIGDSEMIAYIYQQLLEMSNSLYLLREEMKNESQT